MHGATYLHWERVWGTHTFDIEKGILLVKSAWQRGANRQQWLTLHDPSGERGKSHSLPPEPVCALLAS